MAFCTTEIEDDGGLIGCANPGYDEPSCLTCCSASVATPPIPNTSLHHHLIIYLINTIIDVELSAVFLVYSTTEQGSNILVASHSLETQSLFVGNASEDGGLYLIIKYQFNPYSKIGKRFLLCYYQGDVHSF